jgi:hypothetical protein
VSIIFFGCITIAQLEIVVPFARSLISDFN